MINLVVVGLRGAPVGRAMSAQFGPAGGTVGRAPTNTLVLDDPDRTVSRVHAQIECRNGQFFILDRGSNPLQHNGQALGSGRETVLSPGDRLVVGSFELMVQNAASAAAPPSAVAPAVRVAATPAPDDDPFADLLAGLGPGPTPAAVTSPAVSPQAAKQPSVESLLFPDPMGAAAGKGGASHMDDPFADLLGRGSGAMRSTGPGAPDDLSDLGVPAPGQSLRIDELFGGLGGHDPQALSPLDDPLHLPNTASSDDPFAALQSTPKATPDPRSNHVPIAQFGYTPPKAITPPPAAVPRFDDMTGQPVEADDDPFAGLLSGAPPAAPPPPSSPTRPPLEAPVSAAAPMASPPVPRASPPQHAPAPRSPATDDALLAAFLRGVNSTHQMPQALTPELMERIGALLRSSTEGTLQLLHTRQELKREVRAEVTMIAAQANNPLKFSPTVEVALAHLLGPGVRGFMGPEAAMRDAYDDLRAHEFGVMVGMRAALAHVLARFTPDELEKKIAAKSALDSLFAANRKAKLWDQFVALYAGIATEAEDDFHSLFGKAFLKAYDEQMARLKSSR